jgi:hypothetical protein
VTLLIFYLFSGPRFFLICSASQIRMQLSNSAPLLLNWGDNHQDADMASLPDTEYEFPCMLDDHAPKVCLCLGDIIPPPQVSFTITACTCIRDVATVRTFKNLTLSKDERICDFVADGLKMSMEAFLLQCSFYVNGHRVHQPWRLRGSNIDRCRVLIAMTW